MNFSKSKTKMAYPKIIVVKKKSHNSLWLFQIQVFKPKLSSSNL